MGAKVCLHINGALSHQVEHGQLLKAAFLNHGYSVQIVNSPEGSGDIHVVSGPHFAKSRWLDHPKTILLDRCYYRGDPRNVSLGWLRPDGGRNFHKGHGRPPPEVKPLKTGNRTLFLADYNGKIEQADTVRYHPAQKPPSRPLEDDLNNHDVAIGYGTTTLVQAALAGLQIVCKSKANIMSNPDWLELLPYADWGLHEFDDAIEHLLCHCP